jgi:signal transduction histidine kinase/streptogramin lyase
VKPYTPKSVEPVLEPWRWRKHTELSGHEIRCMDEANDGTLWFGGTGGLLRYDGLEADWIEFGPDFPHRETSSIPREKMWCDSVFCMPDGSVLLIVEGRLIRWDDGEWEVVFEGSGLAQYKTYLVGADDGTIWLLRPDVLWHISPDLSGREAVMRSGRDERMIAFCLDMDGDAWVVLDHSKNGAELRHIPLLNGKPLKEMQWSTYSIGGEENIPLASICAGRDGRIWFADSRGSSAIRAFNKRTSAWETGDFSEPMAHFSIIRGRNDTIWASGAGSLSTVRGSRRAFFSADKLGLPKTPLTLFESSNGWLWVIARTGHVFSIDPGDSQWWSLQNLHFECESGDGWQWFCSKDSTVVSYHPESGQWFEHTKRDGMNVTARSVFSTRNGLIWVAGRRNDRAALSVLDGEQWKTFTYPGFSTAIGTKACLEARDGTVLIGAAGRRLREEGAGGMLRFQATPEGPEVFKRYSPPDFPYTVACLAQTPDGIIWGGSVQDFSFDPERGMESFETVSELPNELTYDIEVDADGNLWVAKGAFGIFRKKGAEWTRFTDGDGIHGMICVDLLPLQDGSLLVASDKGVIRFDGSTWSGSFLSDDFAFTSRGGNMRSSQDGAIWFNFIEGDSRSPRVAMNLGLEFCTVRYKPDSKPPQTWIHEHQEQTDSEGNIHLSWSGRDPWANTPEDRLEYSWRLDGGEWSPFTSDVGKTLIGLKGGSHLFEVRARDRDFNIDPTPAQSAFSVAYPVWRRPWFVLIMLAILGGIVTFVWMIIYYRERELKQQQRHLAEMDQVKTGFFTNISHELNTPLGLIRAPIEYLKEHNHDPEARAVLDVAMRNIDRMSNLVSQILDLQKLEHGRLRIKPVLGDIAQSIRDCVEMMRPYAERRNIRLLCECDGSCRGWFDPEALQKITSNLISNAIKYSKEGGRVEVTFRVEEKGSGRMLSLAVEDSGRGIAPEHLPHVFERFYRIPEENVADGSGIGLNLTKELVDLWGGRIDVESPVHADPERPGSRFSVYLPIDPDDIAEESRRYEEQK